MATKATATATWGPPLGRKPSKYAGKYGYSPKDPADKSLMTYPNKQLPKLGDIVIYTRMKFFRIDNPFTYGMVYKLTTRSIVSYIIGPYNPKHWTEDKTLKKSYWRAGMYAIKIDPSQLPVNRADWYNTMKEELPKLIYK